jgi:hypothetical protein
MRTRFFGAASGLLLVARRSTVVDHRYRRQRAVRRWQGGSGRNRKCLPRRDRLHIQDNDHDSHPTRRRPLTSRGGPV